MNTDIALTTPSPLTPQTKEMVLLGGDLSKLSVEQRLAYYDNLCQSLGLNPLTRPFEYIVLNNKLTLYAKKDCTDQLRNIHKISIEIKDRRVNGDSYEVVAVATLPSSRSDEAIGAVFLPEKGEARANAIMKAETKAKRRVTLSVCGLGWIDETEVETIHGAKIVQIDPPTEAKEPAEQVTLSRFAYVIQQEIKKLDLDHVAKFLSTHPINYEEITARPVQEKYYADLMKAIHEQSLEKNNATQNT